MTSVSEAKKLSTMLFVRSLDLSLFLDKGLRWNSSNVCRFTGDSCTGTK